MGRLLSAQKMKYTTGQPFIASTIEPNFLTNHTIDMLLLQAFCNMAHNKDFAASIASDPDLMEGFIVGCMVHTNRYMSYMLCR